MADFNIRMRYTNRVIIFILTDSQVFRHLLPVIIYLGDVSLHHCNSLDYLSQCF